MSKQLFDGSILFGPVPAVLVTTINAGGQPNVFTVAWIGVACSKPPIISIAVRKERLSYENIVASREFVINLTTREMAKLTDFCGCRSGRKIDKIKHLGLELEEGVKVRTPSLKKSPVALECLVKSITELGTHDLILAEIVQNKVDKSLIDEKGKIQLGRTGLLSYCHGDYYAQGKHPLGSFGFSVASRAVRQAQHQRRFRKK